MLLSTLQQPDLSVRLPGMQARNATIQDMCFTAIFCCCCQSCNDGMSQLSQAKLHHRQQLTVLQDDMQQLKNQVRTHTKLGHSHIMKPH
jgi:hypothetical protein